VAPGMRLPDLVEVHVNTALEVSADRRNIIVSLLPLPESLERINRRRGSVPWSGGRRRRVDSRSGGSSGRGS
jgi:hypothetical protein